MACRSLGADGGRGQAPPFHRHHIIERYGLLRIIAMGEITLAISHGFARVFEDHAARAPALTARAALVIACSVFWISFAAEKPLKSCDFRTVFLRGDGHVVIFAAIVARGAGITAEIDLAGASMPSRDRGPGAGRPRARSHQPPSRGAQRPDRRTQRRPGRGGLVPWRSVVLVLGLWAVRERDYPLACAARRYR